MNIEQIEKAIELLEPGVDMPKQPHTWQDVDDACKVAVAVMKDYAARLNPQPLTLEELRERVEADDNAIWVVEFEYPSVHTRAILDGDCENGVFAVWHGGEDQRDFFIEADYGKTWIAYDHEPQEGV